MDEETKARRAAWRAQARADLRRPRTWIIFAGLYVGTYLLVAFTIFILDWTVPFLPWIPKPYINYDPPPLVTAFYCANLVIGMSLLLMIVLYFFYDPKRMEKRKKN